MKERSRIDFCIECRKDTEYSLQKKNITKIIKDKEYTFELTIAVCKECGEEMSIPGLIDTNIQEMDEQYREMEGIISIEEIEKLMKLYKIGKAPLSLALGFGEVTITRYLAGQIPSKDYSDIMKRALTSPVYMKKLLTENRYKIADTAYHKAMEAADDLKKLFCVSDKMLRVLSYIFEKLEEVTPLTLQKLLYFNQGVYSAIYQKPLFLEECQAWIHGPVYPDVYNMFRDFKYSPIEDDRFAVFDGTEDRLTEEEKEVIDHVLNTFGRYSGRVLEQITHCERPWKDARDGYGDQIPTKEALSKESIKAYFETVNETYDISREKGLRMYIDDMLEQ